MKHRNLYSYGILLAMLLVVMTVFSACGGETDNPGTTEKRFTVVFDANGGSCSVESLKTSADGKLVALPVPENIGFSFEGWYESKSGGTAKTIEDVFTTDTTLYALWAPRGDNYRDNTMVNVSFNVTEDSFTQTMGTEEYTWRDTADVVWQKREPLSDSVLYYYEGTSGFFSAQIWFNADGTVSTQASYPTSGLTAGVGTWSQEGDIITFSVTDTRALVD